MGPVAGRIDRAAAVTIAALSFALIATNPLHAQEDQWYVGLGLGESSYSKDKSTSACKEFDLTCEVDETDIAVKIMGGYQFNPHIAVEFGFVDLGEASVDEAALGAEVLAFSGSGVYVAAIPELPLSEHFSIFAELGVALMNTEVEGVKAGPLSVLLGGSSSEDVWSPIYGLGVAGNLKRWTFRLLWEHWDPDTDHNLNGAKVPAPEVDLFGLAVIYRF